MKKTDVRQGKRVMIYGETVKVGRGQHGKRMDDEPKKTCEAELGAQFR